MVSTSTFFLRLSLFSIIEIWWSDIPLTTSSPVCSSDRTLNGSVVIFELFKGVQCGQRVAHEIRRPRHVQNIEESLFVSERNSRTVYGVSRFFFIRVEIAYEAFIL